MDVWTDSDWAGDRDERKSTSGGVVRLGSHCIKAWSSTQKTIALSSGEAEFIALVKGGSIGIGVSSMLSDLGIAVDSRLHLSTDSAAAKGISSRRGLGKIRHLDLGLLWIQQKVNEGSFIVKKVPGEANLSDGLTKYLENQKILTHLSLTNQTFMSERHPLMPNITTDQ